MIYFLLILIGFLTRFLPHPANFTAIGAIALFSGYYIKDKRLAVGVPLVAMFLSDWIIGLYQWQLLASVYVSFAVVVLLGVLISRKKWFFALPTSLVGTAIFFLVTNFAFWQFGGFYTYDIAGLLACYSAGLPFLKNSFAGDLTFTVILFSLAESAVFLAQKTSLKVRLVLLAGGRREV